MRKRDRGSGSDSDDEGAKSKGGGGGDESQPARMDWSEAARILGSMTSPRKAVSSAQNGLLGGRPELDIAEEVECTCGCGPAVPPLEHVSSCKRWRTAYQRARRARQRSSSGGSSGGSPGYV